MDEAYETDILAWSHHQASLLRRYAAGEKLNETPDWANIIEEIEDVGGNVLRAVRSHLLQAMLHELKVRAWPESRDVPHWQAEVRGQRGEAADDFTPAMRQHVDLAALYRRALRRVPDMMDGQPPRALPETCPWSLDELLGEDELR
jgi:hypothetical protein